MMLFCLFFFATDFAGNCACRSAQVTPEPTEERENFDSIKRKHIQSVVDKLPLGKIIVLHARARSVDYAAYNINPEDCIYFRECVRQRYDENEEEIHEIMTSQNERYRRVVFAPHVHIVNLRRNRRQSMPEGTTFPNVSAASGSESPVSLDHALD